MDLLGVLELKLIEISNKKNNLNEFRYIGQKYDILDRIGKLICRAVIRKEKENIKRYIQSNYSIELSIDDLLQYCFESVFTINNDYEWIVYNGVELCEHNLFFTDVLPYFNQECKRVIDDIEKNTLNLF